MIVRSPILGRVIARPRFRNRHQRAVARLIATGNAANASKRWGEAETACAAALALNPRRTEVWVQHGHALKEQGFLQKARESYVQALTLDDDDDADLQLGHVLKLQGHMDVANLAYGKSCLRDPVSPHSRAELEAAGVELPSNEAVALFHLPSLARGQPTSTINADGSARQQAHVTSERGIPKTSFARTLADEATNLFDAEFYYYTNPGVREMIAAPSRDRCLQHFCEFGIESMFTIGEHLAFDPSFYLRTYLAHPTFTLVNAYRHWLTVGIVHGWAPNQTWWTRQTLSERLDGIDDLNILLAATTKDEAFLKESWAAYFDWFAREASGWPRCLCSAVSDRIVR